MFLSQDSMSHSRIFRMIEIIVSQFKIIEKIHIDYKKSINSCEMKRRIGYLIIR